MSGYVVRKDDADELARLVSDRFPVGSGGPIGEVLSAIYQLAANSHDEPTA